MVAGDSPGRRACKCVFQSFSTEICTEFRSYWCDPPPLRSKKTEALRRERPADSRTLWWWRHTSSTCFRGLSTCPLPPHPLQQAAFPAWSSLLGIIEAIYSMFWRLKTNSWKDFKLTWEQFIKSSISTLQIFITQDSAVGDLQFKSQSKGLVKLCHGIKASLLAFPLTTVGRHLKNVI